jgi:hypothetical protein
MWFFTSQTSKELLLLPQPDFFAASEIPYKKRFMHFAF